MVMVIMAAIIVMIIGVMMLSGSIFLARGADRLGECETRLEAAGISGGVSLRGSFHPPLPQKQNLISI